MAGPCMVDTIVKCNSIHQFHNSSSKGNTPPITDLPTHDITAQIRLTFTHIAMSLPWPPAASL